MASSQIIPFKESKEHSYHRRAFAHNYFAPFIYHIILKKRKDCDSFGKLTGDAKIKYGQSGCAEIVESPLGKIISKAIIHLPYKFPILKNHQFKVMPDHVHYLLEITAWSPYHLDFYIDDLRDSIASKYAKLTGESKSDEDIFEPGYCDKPLLLKISLDGWYNYIRENPHRLAMRIQYPLFFQRIRNLKIDNKEYEAYGNLFLFRNPDKTAVKMSDKYSQETKIEKFEFYQRAFLTGSVLVSPFIHKDEKAIRLQAEQNDAKIILIQHEKFPELYKPARHDFEQCGQGNLLIISMGYPKGTTLTREISVKMNDLARLICHSS